MALPVRQQMKYWGIATAVLFVLLWGLGNVMLPFIVGGAVAYFLDPVADRLQRFGMSRVGATTLISLVGLLIFIIAALLIVPTLVRQLGQLINVAPTIFAELQGFLTTQFPSLMDSESVLRETLAGIGATIKARGGELVAGALSSALSLLNAVVFMVVVPVVAFYLLMDWDRLIAKVDGWLPRDHQPVIRRLAREIDAVLAGFVRGQVSVCLTLGTYYSVALIAAGLQFGLVVGALAGLITFIPYVGALLGGALALGLALYQFWGDWLSIGIVAGIFFFGQFLEGNVLTPKLVGKSVGLHPVWLLFALSVFGAIFGFVGLLIAVPVAAAMGVLARFAMAQYLDSLLFTGVSDKGASDKSASDKSDDS